MTDLGVSSGPDRAEKRESYTDVIVSSLVQHAAGGLTLSPLGLGVLEAASGALSRALALATVSPARAAAVLTPTVRADIGRRLLRHGQSLHVLHADSSGLRLIPGHSWDPSGQPFGELRYRVDIAAPDGVATRDYPATSVLHVRLSSDPASPWIGTAPLSWAITSARLATAMETRLGQEADTPVGQLITSARDPGGPSDEADEDEDPNAGLKRDLANLKGELVLVESQTTGTGEPNREGPRKDWSPNRVGADPPATLASLRSDAEHCLAAALGYPATLLSPNSDGTAQRECWRRYLHGTLLPVAQLVCEEVERVLETPCSLTFERLEAGDISGRSRAFGQMRKAGLTVQAAARLAGLEGVTEADIDAGTPVQAPI